MEKKKYSILLDHYNEGWAFKDETFDYLADAVKFATENNYGQPFLIVEIIHWVAQQID